MTLTQDRDLSHGLIEEAELVCDTYCIVIYTAAAQPEIETVVSVVGPFTDMVEATKRGEAVVENLRLHSEDQVRYEVRALWPPD